MLLAWNQTHNLKKCHIILLVGAVRLSLLGTSAIIGPIISAPDVDDKCAALVGTRTGKGNRSTKRKRTTMPSQVIETCSAIRFRSLWEHGHPCAGLRYIWQHFDKEFLKECLSLPTIVTETQALYAEPRIFYSKSQLFFCCVNLKPLA
jgi:hypothetical protein